MFMYFIPLTVNLTKNSKLEKFVHALNALWKLSGSSMGALRELATVAGNQCHLICDLKTVPYNLAMMIDWDSHLNVEYSGSVYCALYLYKYCYKGASKREQIAFELEKERNSLDEIMLFMMYGRIMSSMSAVWHLYGYQDYPATESPDCAFKVCTGAQLKDFINQCKVTDLQIYYSQPASLKDLKYTEFLAKFNTSKTLPLFYSNNPETENDVSLD
jgi:hypothetical protein